ncbi:DgyrCDS4618 [Dimorphilus gyrociliatus]|uniref:DgyrCDS4618 n=1 Tax=Dimorphilus gyrociliatus TaxID=2664684 RepID=A0A7I8VIY9_9ANNE|nr:DgyrCDS4618 [Dimorphilus gyrociliatus]
MKLTIAVLVFCNFFLASQADEYASDVYVQSVQPKYGGTNGGVKLTIHGKKFAADLFSLEPGSESKKLQVKLISETSIADCDIHQNDCSPEQIVCYTKPMLQGTYHVRVTMNGKKIPLTNYCRNQPKSYACSHHVRDNNTPKIKKIVKQSGPPKSIVEIWGKIFTVRYGSNILSANATNNRLNIILRYYFGSQNCELLKNPSRNEPYKMILDGKDGEKETGTIACKLQGSYVGNLNGSLLIDGDLGKSATDVSLFRVSRKGKIYLFQTYAEIESVSPTQGGTEGGSLVKVKGRFFDETDSKATVTVGGEKAKVLKVEDNEITLLTPAAPASASGYSGNRGINIESWTTTKTFANIDDIRSMTSSDPGYKSEWLDETNWVSEDDQPKSFRSRMYYVAPKNSTYQFAIKSKGVAKLYFSENGEVSSLTKIAEATKHSENFKSEATQISEIKTLIAGNTYLLEWIHSGKGSLLGVFQFKSDLNSAQTGVAVDDVQQIESKTDTLPEIQTLDITNLPKAKNGKNEVQKIKITSTNPDTKFTLTFNEIKTPILPISIDYQQMTEVLNGLPTIRPGKVSVKRKEKGSQIEFEVKFLDNIGERELIKIEIPPEFSGSSGTVTRSQTGTPSYSKFALKYSQSLSGPTTNNPVEIHKSLSELFGIRCHGSMVNPIYQHAVALDYEDGGKYKGTLDSDEEPFCGKTSLKNPGALFQTTKPINLKDNRYLCLAYRGQFHDSIRIRYKYYSFGMKTLSNMTASYLVLKTPNHNNRKWHYECFDMQKQIEIDRKSTEIVRIMLYDVYLWRSITGTKDNFVDALYIGSDNIINRLPNVADVRKVPDLRAKDLKVEKTSNGIYKISFLTWDCVSGLDKLEVYNVQSSDFSVTQDQAISRGVRGAYDVSLEGKTINLNINMEDDEVKDAFEEFDEFGSVSVKRYGGCYDRKWKIRFLTKPGDVPDITIADKSGISGNGADVSIVSLENGAMLYAPVPGDMVSTFHVKPQIAVEINNIPVRCLGDCSFQYKSDLVPTITDIQPKTGSVGTQITLTGTGFDSTTIAKNKFSVGDSDCTVSSATATEIKCTLGAEVSGDLEMSFYVEGKGRAKFDLGTFTYTPVITSFDPTSSNAGGNSKLTINGAGFSKGITITIGSNKCRIINLEINKIVCIVPPSGGSTTAVVKATKDSNDYTAPSDFTYSAVGSVSIAAIDKTEVTVFGGEEIVITGTGFGELDYPKTKVTIGDRPALVESWENDKIIITTPKLAAGEHDVNVHIPSYGVATDSSGNVMKVKAVLEISGLSPKEMSLFGGATLTLTGNGFGTEVNAIKIRAGNVICKPISVTDTEILCEMGWAGKTTYISNKGSIESLGKGYAWEKKTTEVELGDNVIWNWESPSEKLKFTVYETDSIKSLTPKTDGFAYSGPRSEKGSFKLATSTVGEFTYSSGYIDESKSIKLQGKLIVKKEQESLLRDLEVSVNGVKPQIASGSLRKKRSTTCSPVQVPGCTAAKPATAGLQVGFWSCLSSTVTEVSPNEGSLSSEITITGTGFSANKECVEVLIGGQKAIIVSSSSTQIVFKIDPAVPIKTEILHEVQVVVKGNGFATNRVVKDSSRYFKLIPNIDSISPTMGSLIGGTEVTINGGGFVKDNLKVKIGTDNCSPLKHTFSTIVCVTEPSLSEKTVTVDIKLNGKSLSCTDCDYQYKDSSTPAVTSVTPLTISSETEIEIVGNNLGSDADLLEILVGDVKCSDPTYSGPNIKCSLPYANIGKNSLKVFIKGTGRATVPSSISLTGVGGVTGINPAEGSSAGGLLVTVSGNGFTSTDKVFIANKECKITSISPGQIICKTPSGSGTAQVKITYGGKTDESKSFVYKPSVTPQITGVDLTTGLAGDKLTITGTNFGNTADKNKVFVGQPCDIETASSTSIVCTIDESEAGQYDVVVKVERIGDASGSFKFDYQLTVASITSSTGSLEGGQAVTITGNGFSKKSSVNICGECKVTKATSTSVECTTPAVSGSTEKVCDVVVTTNSVTATKSAAFTYSNANTPTITSVSPLQGGSAGGTMVAIKGSGFGNDKSNIHVTNCLVKTVQDKLITCRTVAKSTNDQFPLNVHIKSKGTAKGTFNFAYKDVWSSLNTWGGDLDKVPKAGDFVIIEKGQTMYLDTDTPVLKMLLIKGGKLIFEDSNDMALRAENILILDGGLLQIGTEDEPFKHVGVIELYGHLRALELPVYGAKTLAVRNGTLDLHGQPVKSWTQLDGTVEAGDKIITLTHPVNWKNGDKIVIASTGGHLSQNENEEHQIKSISSNGKTITLEESIKYRHLGITQTFQGGVKLETRAEVGLLSRNVIVRGSNDPQWNQRIEACPDGFDVGEFAVQTCFQGRHGEEIGSDQFGGQIMLHQPSLNDKAILTRISHVELTYMGQAFRLGRYPIHFHLNGDMEGSYVRGCAIHKTFNRAVNIHNTHNVLIEHNIIYNIMGGAFFLEDSIETGNILQYNLALFVRSSSSLLNDDVSAAAFWITHPNNIVQHNHVAGGTHFGFWYRMLEHPQGPSFDLNICPRNAPMGVFSNNTVHSCGWYGLWIFEDYHPTLSGKCKDKEASPAIFKKLTAYNNFRGAEWVHCGAMQFQDFVVANNYMAGVEMYFIIRKTEFPYYSEKGALLKDLTVIGHLNSDERPPCTKRGIVLPFDNGLLIDGVKFINFDGEKNGLKTCSALGTVKIICVCSELCAGFNYKFKRVEWHSCISRADFEWEHQAEFEDIDGTLTGLGAGSRAMSFSHLMPKICIYGTHGVEVKNNVVHRTVGTSIVTNGKGNKIENNLITLNIFPGTYGSRAELGNYEFFASIEIQNGTDTVLKDNVVAGSERVGYRLDGDSCDSSKTSLISNNEAHGVLNGIWLMPEDCRLAESCSKFQGFKISKAWFFGIYVQVPCSVEFDNMILVDNTVGIFPMIIYPSAVHHEFEQKYAKFTNSLVVGTNPQFDCENDLMSANDKSIQAAILGEAWFTKSYGLGRTGISWPLFSSKPNGAPLKPHKFAKKEPAGYGIFRVQNIILAHFKTSCSKAVDKAFSTNPSVPDMAHPIHASDISKFDVQENALFNMHRPNLKYVNGGDCVDMDCDGMKKALLKDLDGSILGDQGAVIPESEFEWNGDARRGLGDYRIPKTMQVTRDGQRKDIDEVRPHKGIIRNDKCTFVTDWTAYKCFGLDYELLLIESLDPDYEERRLSPVAIRSDTGYLDLNNGPRDVGICHGYTCRKRISLFFNLVATSHHYDVHFTSTTPQKLRLHLPNANGNQAVRIAIYWGLQQPVHAYVDNKIILAKNEAQENDRVIYKKTSGLQLPSLDDSAGANFFDVKERTIYVIVRGGKTVELRLKTDSVVLKLGLKSITVEEFYGKNVAEYLRIFLGLDASQVKLMNVVADDTQAVGKRRKRSTSNVEATIEIGNHELDSKTQILTYDNLKGIVDKLKSGLQSGQVSDDLKLDISSIYINQAVPPADDPKWESYITKMSNGNTVSETIQTANKLVLAVTPTVRHEGTKFTTQPAIRIEDALNRPALGLQSSSGGYWKVKAVLKQNAGSDSRAKLIGSTIVNVHSGWANFSDLGISHSGSNYQILFSVYDPTNFKATVQTGGLTVKPRPLTVGHTHPQTVVVGEPLKMKLFLTDAITNEVISDISWRGISWKCHVKSHSIIKNPSILPEHNETFLTHIGYVNRELSFEKPGRHLLKLLMISNHADYIAENYTVINVMPKDYIEPTGPANKTIKLKFDEDFQEYEPKFPFFETALYNDLWTKTKVVKIGKMNFKNGSIIASFHMTGTEDDVKNSLSKIADYVEDGCHLYFESRILKCERYMYVDGSAYEGLDGSEEFNWKLYVLLPVLLSVFALAVLIIAVIVIIKMSKVSKRFHSATKLVPESISPEYSRQTTTVSTKTSSTDRPLSRQDIAARLTPRITDAWTEKA